MAAIPAAVGGFTYRQSRRLGDLLPGLFNRYSGTLLLVMTAFIVGGGAMLYRQHLWAFVPFAIGFNMLRGFRWPKMAKPSKVWLLTLFGQMTTVKTYGITFLLDWIKPLSKRDLDILGYEEFELKKESVVINLTKPIRCSDGQYVEGFVSLSWIPDDEDDPSDFKDRNGVWKSGGEKLRDYGNVDDVSDVIKQLVDILTTWVQEYANGKTSEVMEIEIRDFAAEILQRITGAKGAPGESGNSQYDDTRGLGIKIVKFLIVLRAPSKVIAARVDIQVQSETRRAELVNTGTINQQIAKRLELYVKGVVDDAGNVLCAPAPVDKIPPIDQIRNMIVQENLEHDGKLSQVINQGGFNLVSIGGGAP